MKQFTHPESEKGEFFHNVVTFAR